MMKDMERIGQAARSGLFFFFNTKSKGLLDEIEMEPF